MRNFKYLALTLYILFSFYVFELKFWILLSAFSILITLFYNYKNHILAVSPFFILILNLGFFSKISEHFYGALPDLNNTEVVAYMFITFLIFNFFAYFFTYKFKKYTLSTLFLLLLCAIYLHILSAHTFLNVFFYLVIFLLFKHFFNLIYNSSVDKLTIYESMQSYANFWSLLTAIPIPLQLLRENSVKNENLPEVQKSGLKLLLLTMLWALIFNYLINVLEAKETHFFDSLNFRYGSAYEGFYALNKNNNFTNGVLSIFLIGIGVFTKILIASNYAVSTLRLFGFNLPSTINSKIFQFRDLKGFLSGIYFYYNYLLMHIFLPRVKNALNIFKLKNITYQNYMIFFLFLFGGVGYSVFSTQFYFEYIKDSGSLTKQILYTTLYYLPLAILIVCMHNFKLLRVNSTDKIYLKIIKKIIIVFTFFCLLLVKTSIKYQNWNSEKLLEFFGHFFKWG